jgi:hypothetical protein
MIGGAQEDIIENDGVGKKRGVYIIVLIVLGAGEYFLLHVVN